MRYSFRLAELVGHVPDPRKRPGTIKSIVEYTGLDRHQVASLLKNEVKYIPLKALSRLCDYLIEHGHVSADRLPGALFAVEAENFWELLARRSRLELCVGVRESPEGAWVAASDSVLLGELLNGVSTLGGTSQMGMTNEAEPQEKEEGPAPTTEETPRPNLLRQSLVWSPGQHSQDEVRDRADEVYREFSDIVSDKALICLGSIKSNPVVELVLANAFGCDPFVSEDDVAGPKKRSCPFFLRYREEDPHPASCSAGLKLGKNKPAEDPGIYYEDEDGNWQHCTWQSPHQDAALVFYVHREAQGRLEMVLSGFSGRGTRLLARTLASRGDSFWPPVYEDQGMQIGAFIVRFTLASQDAKRHSHDILRTDLVAETEVIPLSGKAIHRRLRSEE